MSKYEPIFRKLVLLKINFPKSVLISPSQILCQSDILLHDQPCPQFVELTIILRKIFKLFLKFLCFFDIGDVLFKFGIFQERLPHHLLNIYILVVIEVQNDLICNFEF